jgi:DNA repair protein RecO (recombination protein O)
MNLVVTPAVLLGSVPYRESDRIVTLYTRDQGKVSAVARGARKSRRRFGASLSLFVLGEATLREKRTGASELMTLERFDAARDFSALGADVVKLAHASYVTELVHRLTAPRHVDAAIYELLAVAYETIAGAAPSADLLRAVELRLLDELGLRPALDRCAACSATEETRLDEPGAVLDPNRGGLLCARCAPLARGEGIRPLPASARRRLFSLQTIAALADATKITPLDGDTAARAREAMHALIGVHLTAPLRSLEFIQKLRHG